MVQHTLKLSSSRVRALARAWIDRAPEGSLLRLITEPTRTTEQNAKLWPMLTDLSKQCQICGQSKPPETWKFVMMRALKHEVRYETDLNGEPFPIGFSTSNLSKSQFSELIEFMYAYGAENGVKWSERGFHET